MERKVLDLKFIPYNQNISALTNFRTMLEVIEAADEVRIDCFTGGFGAYAQMVIGAIVALDKPLYWVKRDSVPMTRADEVVSELSEEWEAADVVCNTDNEVMFCDEDCVNCPNSMNNEKFGTLGEFPTGLPEDQVTLDDITCPAEEETLSELEINFIKRYGDYNTELFIRNIPLIGEGLARYDLVQLTGTMLQSDIAPTIVIINPDDFKNVYTWPKDQLDELDFVTDKHVRETGDIAYMWGMDVIVDITCPVGIIYGIGAKNIKDGNSIVNFAELDECSCDFGDCDCCNHDEETSCSEEEEAALKKLEEFNVKYGSKTLLDVATKHKLVNEVNSINNKNAYVEHSNILECEIKQELNDRDFVKKLTNVLKTNPELFNTFINVFEDDEDGNTPVISGNLMEQIEQLKKLNSKE